MENGGLDDMEDGKKIALVGCNLEDEVSTIQLMVTGLYAMTGSGWMQ